MRALLVAFLVAAGCAVMVPQSAMAFDAEETEGTDETEEDAVQPASAPQEHIVVSRSDLQRARFTALAAGVVSVVALGTAVLTMGFVALVFTALTIVPYWVPGTSVVRSVAGPVGFGLWTSLLTVAGSVAGASIGVAVAEFLGLVDGNSRIPLHVIVPVALAAVLGTLGALVAASTGLVLFFLMPRLPGGPVILYGSERAVTSDAESTTVPPWWAIVPGLLVSTVAGVGALGATQLGMTLAGRLVRE